MIVPDPDPIRTVDDLHRALQEAIEIELATLPPYLTALWSIRPGTNTEAAAIIRSVAMEEMLHAAIVANVMNALRTDLVGPTLPGDGARSFPHALPHSDGHVVLQLRPLDEVAVKTFIAVEAPDPPDAKPKLDGYHTIGQFYDAVLEGIAHLGDDAFSDPPARQLPPTSYYGGGGVLSPVHDAASARRAIEEIRTQGEGGPRSIDDGDDRLGQRFEVAHYYRFQELGLGRTYLRGDQPGVPTGPPVRIDDSGVEPMDPDLAAHVGQLPRELQDAIADFDTTYAALLSGLEAWFRGDGHAGEVVVPVMYQLERQGQGLLRVPIGDGLHAGPLWRCDPA